MKNLTPIKKLALIEDNLLALIDKPSRSPKELRQIPELENQAELLRATISNDRIKARMSDPAYTAKIKAMPKIKPQAD